MSQHGNHLRFAALVLVPHSTEGTGAGSDEYGLVLSHGRKKYLLRKKLREQLSQEP